MQPFPTAPTPSPQTAAPGAWRVMVVDDNIDAASTLALLLELVGHRTCTANDGPEALRLAVDFDPQVVLLDIGLPGLNGHETARRLRQAAGGPERVLVALTGWSSPGDRSASLDAGFDAHLVKPVDHDHLLDLLASLMAARSTPARGVARTRDREPGLPSPRSPPAVVGRASDGRHGMGTESDFGGEDSTDVSGGEEALDAIELLTNDHEEARQLFDEYEQLVADAASDGDRQALAEQICDVLTVHMTAEQELFYPAARSALGDGELIDEAEEEHASAEALIARLREIDPADAAYDDTMRLLRETVEQHVLEEEGELFPQLRDSSLDLPRLGEEIARRKEEVEAELLDEDS